MSGVHLESCEWEHLAHAGRVLSMRWKLRGIQQVSNMRPGTCVVMCRAHAARAGIGAVHVPAVVSVESCKLEHASQFLAKSA